MNAGLKRVTLNPANNWSSQIRGLATLCSEWALLCSLPTVTVQASLFSPTAGWLAGCEQIVGWDKPYKVCKYTVNPSPQESICHGECGLVIAGGGGGVAEYLCYLIGNIVRSPPYTHIYPVSNTYTQSRTHVPPGALLSLFNSVQCIAEYQPSIHILAHSVCVCASLQRRKIKHDKEIHFYNSPSSRHLIGLWSCVRCVSGTKGMNRTMPN